MHPRVTGGPDGIIRRAVLIAEIPAVHNLYPPVIPLCRGHHIEFPADFPGKNISSDPIAVMSFVRRHKTHPVAIIPVKKTFHGDLLMIARKSSRHHRTGKRVFHRFPLYGYFHKIPLLYLCHLSPHFCTAFFWYAESADAVRTHIPFCAILSVS